MGAGPSDSCSVKGVLQLCCWEAQMLQVVLRGGGKGCKEGARTLIIFLQLFISPQMLVLPSSRLTATWFQSKAKQEIWRRKRRTTWRLKWKTTCRLTCDEMPYLGFLESQVITGNSGKPPRAQPSQHGSESRQRLQVKLLIQMLREQPHTCKGTGCGGKGFSFVNFSFQVSMKDADGTAL